MARKGKMLVLANATAGKDAEFNKWYNEIHLNEVCGLRGMGKGVRYKLDLQMIPQGNPEFGYVTVYDMPDVDAANAHMAEFAPKATLTDAMDFAKSMNFQMEEIFSYKK
jgi:hypothetical protein